MIPAIAETTTAIIKRFSKIRFFMFITYYFAQKYYGLF
ncbi:hypothetical protein BD94_3004 [Elizabethkingia anophelis NUHP1]|uniref:Uncharacterized protein n=1 Tax=Elizabethkingia anophelis NUHP1 TaxID=1338011 RepID=A0A077EKK9_9FLAO|nr:hypothetical protein BD94_3004 [Elizabethkingia anophelis NUHP1]